MLNSIAVMIGLALLLLQCSVSGAGSGPWNVRALRVAPKFTVIERKGNLCSLYYDGEPFKGKPTRVFAYCAYPEGVKGPAPAIVLVHGGLGRAFADWAQMWADRGYVALAMDVFGQGIDGKPDAEGGPALYNETMFAFADVKDSWPYAGVADVIKGVSLVSSLPEVDPKRVGITGISWGGYLTCIVAGLDDRLRAVAPIYGCGFLHEASAWSTNVQGMPEPLRKIWIEQLDPSSYLPRVKAPTLFINGTNDHCFWLDSYQKSYRLVKRRTVCVKVEMAHSQGDGANPVEIGLFMDRYLKSGAALPELGQPKREGNSVQVRFKATVPVANAELHYTTDTGAWQDRKWQSVAAKIDGPTVRAELPTTRPLAYFISLTDTRKAIVTTEHEVLTDVGPKDGN